MTAPLLRQTDFLWRPALIVFISNAALMALQLVAGRIMAPLIGVSHYTWTTIIGVMLSGMSIGYLLGGRLADRFASRRLLGVTFVLSGLGSLLVLAMAVLLNTFADAFLSTPLLLRMVVFVGGIFLLPSMLIGLIPPLVVKLTLSNLARTGYTVGRIYAMSSLGSILGTFVTGYVLLANFGVRSIVLGVAGVLVLMGLAVGAAEGE